MGYVSLKITIMSATDLKKVKLIGKMDVYVVASVSSDPRSMQQTPVHKDSGTCPSWNHTVKFIVDEVMARSGESVVFQVKHQDTFGGDKAIGDVRVPLKDLILDKKEAQSETYEVCRPSGKLKGALKILYRAEDVFDQPLPPLPAYPSPQASSSSALHSYLPPQTPYPTVVHPLLPQTGYPYPPQQPTAYSYPQQPLPQRPRRNEKLAALGAGLIGNLLRDLVIGNMVSHANQDGNYDGDAGDFNLDFWA